MVLSLPTSQKAVTLPVRVMDMKQHEISTGHTGLWYCKVFIPQTPTLIFAKMTYRDPSESGASPSSFDNQYWYTSTVKRMGLEISIVRE